MHVCVPSMSSNKSTPKTAAAADHPSETLEGTSVASDWVVVDESASRSTPFEDGRDAAVVKEPRNSVQLSAEMPEKCRDAGEKTASEERAEEDTKEGEAGFCLSQKISEDDGELELDVCFICDCTGSMGIVHQGSAGKHAAHCKDVVRTSMGQVFAYVSWATGTIHPRTRPM